ncbi:Restriction of telomere capping protein 5 [Podosphaera aphanis]|nr:Restriction of telomere capping protein 5 [Podosphaera aphanis]
MPDSALLILLQALKFAKNCFTPLELYSFQDVFKSLADHQATISFIREDALAQFLEIPKTLGVSSILYQMLTDLGAFPFGQDAPAILGFEEMVMIVVIITGRYQKVLGKGNRERCKILFRSLAVNDLHESDQKISEREKDEEFDKSPLIVTPNITGDSNTDGEDEDIDELSLAALLYLHAADNFKESDFSYKSHSSIPPDSLKKLITLLLFIAPLEGQESLSLKSGSLVSDHLDELRRTADNILAAFFDVEKIPGVELHEFDRVVTISMPFLFDGLGLLFERFLFAKTLDFRKQKNLDTILLTSDLPTIKPILPLNGEILDMNILSQLSFFLPRTSLFRHLRLLYSGSEAGFSMGSFETSVFNWRAPTILLVSGFQIPDLPLNQHKRISSEALPPKRFPNSSISSRVLFGVYLTQHWRRTYKDCFGDSNTRLFQLEPVHEVFHASSSNTDYATFTRSPTSFQGISLGCPHPKTKQSTGLSTNISLGAVSLVLDSSFEFGVFTHDYTSGGGAFHTSSTRKSDWQDQFEIDGLEVWGCGGEIEIEKQKTMWQWEEREAEARRRINLGTGDMESDRALLEMAGIIGGNRSGGSMN